MEAVTIIYIQVQVQSLIQSKCNFDAVLNLQQTWIQSLVLVSSADGCESDSGLNVPVPESQSGLTILPL